MPYLSHDERLELFDIMSRLEIEINLHNLQSPHAKAIFAFLHRHIVVGIAEAHFMIRNDKEGRHILEPQPSRVSHLDPR